MTTVAGNTRGYADGRGSEARFDTPTGLAIDERGTLYVADTGQRSRARGHADGDVSTLIDSSQGLFRPLGLAAASTGELYVTTEDGQVFERAADGALRVVAGTTAWVSATVLVVRHSFAVRAASPGTRRDDSSSPIRATRWCAASRRARSSAPRAPLWPGKPRFDVEMFALRPLLWPLDPLYGPFEVAGTMGEARGEDAGRFHAGVDVRAEQGSAVLAVREGVVQAPLAVSGFGTLDESIRVGPLAYVHVRAGRDRQGRLTDARFAATFDETGRLVDVRAKRGARFAVGDVVGTVNPFNHVHLNVGWPGEEYNPLLFRLAQFRDSIPPTIAAGGIQLFSSDGERLTGSCEAAPARVRRREDCGRCLGSSRRQSAQSSARTLRAGLSGPQSRRHGGGRVRLAAHDHSLRSTGRSARAGSGVCVGQRDSVLR